MIKRILFITAYPPNDRTAGQNYTQHLLTDLSKNYQVDLIYWKYGNHQVSLPGKIDSIACYVTNSFLKTLFYSVCLGIFPLFTVRFNWNVVRYLRQIASRYDMIYFDYSQTFIYSFFVNHPYKVKMCHDIIAQKYSRKKFAFVYNWWVRLSEHRFLDKQDYILCFSEKDQCQIASLYDLKADVVAFYIDSKIKDMNLSVIQLEQCFFFYGAWNRKENSEGLIWFIKEVLPHCKNSVRFKVIGGGLSDDLVDIIAGCSNMEYVGFVDNPYSQIVKCQALIAPLFNGAGVKVKVVETLALGTPVIGTDIAFEGIKNIVAGSRHALTTFHSSLQLAKLLNEFQPVSLNEKIELRSKFFSSYSNNKFVDILRRVDVCRK